MSTPSPASRPVLLRACPLCDARTWSIVVDAGAEGYEWVRCDCGAVFKHRGPVGAQAQPWIGQDDPATEAHYDEAYFSRYGRRRRRRVSKSRRQILDAMEVLEVPPGRGGTQGAGAGARLLDVGCSLGYTLEAARNLGLDPIGVDVSDHAVSACRRAGYDARCAGLDALPFEDATFSIAILKHVFEHTGEPRRALVELRRVLRRGAVAFFAVPDLRYFKAARSPSTSRFFRGRAAREHFVYYSPQTLARIVEQEGFAVAGVHPRRLHRRCGSARLVADVAMLPLKATAALVAEALALRKEFWLVAVRR